MKSAFLEVRHLLVLAVPLILAQVAQMSMSFIDTLMVGRLGDEALAGIALGGTLFFFMMSFSVGVLFAVGPMVSQAAGAGNQEAAGKAVRQGLWLGLGLTALAALVFWNAEALFLLANQNETTAAKAAAYIRAIAWGFLPALWLVALRGLLEGLLNPRPIMFITLAGVAMNITADSILIFGYLGFPALGLVGAGIASALVYWLMFVLALIYVRYRYGHYGVFSGLRVPDFKTLLELVTIGLPIGLTIAFETGLFAVTALLMGLFGTTALAAHQIALQTASLTFMVAVGMSIATSVRVGQAVGRRDPDAARRSGYVGIVMSASLMALSALSFWLVPQQIISLYVDVSDPANRELVRLAAGFLGFAAIFQVFDGLQVSAAGALRGLKDTRIPMLISLLSYWGAGLSAGILFAFGLGLGGRGLWLGLAVGLATAAVLLTLRFARNVSRRRLARVSPAKG